MEKQLKINGEIILQGLKIKKQLTISDIVRDIGLKRCEVRVAVAFLLGRKQIKERPIGMAKEYRLK